MIAVGLIVLPETANEGIERLQQIFANPNSKPTVTCTCISNTVLGPTLLSTSGVTLSLNGHYIPNHYYVNINDIGSTDDTAIICNTNRIANIDGGQQLHSGGDWFAPDGTTVGDQGSDDVPGFERNRRPMMVQLVRSTTTGTPSEGIYYCVVEDDTFTNQTVYVGLYNSGGGGIV